MDEPNGLKKNGVIELASHSGDKHHAESADEAAADMIKPKDNHGNGDVESGVAEFGDDDPTRGSHQEEADAILTKLKGELSYGIDDVPAWYTAFLLGFQHYLTMVGATVAVPLFLKGGLCISDDYVTQAELIATMFFVSGIATLLQTTFGCRLPIVQGGTFSFLAPTFAILSVKGACPPSPSVNASMEELANQTKAFQDRIREIQGDIMVASLFQVLIGFTGTIGIMLRFIGPLSITPTICLIGLGLFKEAADFAAGHWGIAFMTIGLLTIFSQYISRFGVPFYCYNKGQGCHSNKFFIFKLFPVILAILISWIFCAILTSTNVFPTEIDDYGFQARTDTRFQVLQEASWFRFPYPGQWGLPTVTVAGVFGMLAGVIASMIESVGDYYACARMAGAPPPPNHAVNRGIGMEGISCLIAGMFGSGNGTTSYSENIGAIGITKVGSRRVIQYGALIMIFLGTFTKFSAIFVMIPDPIVGGMFCVMFGMVAAVGLSNLQFVDLNSSRNLFILGFSLFMGLCIPNWVKSGTNDQYINTGVNELDLIIVVLLKTGMFVGGFFGFVLDNTIPGTKKERGIGEWQRFSGSDGENEVVNDLVFRCYDFPFGMAWIRSKDFFSYLPFSPTFKGWRCRGCCQGGRRSALYRLVPARFRSADEV
ncbi:solute carrier family 23 member 1-like [Strongylocentrotus purpuratus]|uniref:Solute carrier family 23 member 2 n=1 Tax=Strongylocentrotus purpuratus TaxID=7668 RepID=A0A7M7PAC8_STRPU|nr:solute carrier family 23 member 1-like [Strongylocentrotus purpuratus]